MWEGVKKNSIQFFYESQNKEHNFFLFPRNSPEISNGLRMLKYIYIEEKKNFFSKNFDSQKDCFKSWEKSIGFLVRINAYTNILCSLEKIIAKTYKETRDYIKILGYKNILQKDKTTERNKEIEHFLFWRNKVFAHTAYTNPNKYFYNSKSIKRLGLCKKCAGKLKEESKEGIENVSTQLTSLAYFGGTAYSCGKKSFQIGGYSKQQGKIEAISFPVIDIADNHLKIVRHFEMWEKMFVEILNGFKNIKREDIIKNNKHILKIEY